MKYSRQRELILKTVAESREHPSADEVYQAVREADPKLSLGTVYRNLGLLAESGAIVKIPVTGGADRFDGDTSRHLHMKCARCGGLTDIVTDALAGIDEAVARETGEHILSHDLIFEGICKDCLQNAKPFRQEGTEIKAQDAS
ncbi:MAG: transcriptional repressor [Clostridiales Family XIII bacterium]|jgi:Fe2+ or Zn2+ uptake regulation protein|nr:transcriptional repressor [Clostridiales Family XIII bacterium]